MPPSTSFQRSPFRLPAGCSIQTTHWYSLSPVRRRSPTSPPAVFRDGRLAAIVSLAKQLVKWRRTTRRAGGVGWIPGAAGTRDRGDDGRRIPSVPLAAWTLETEEPRLGRDGRSEEVTLMKNTGLYSLLRKKSMLVRLRLLPPPRNGQLFHEFDRRMDTAS